MKRGRNIIAAGLLAMAAALPAVAGTLSWAAGGSPAKLDGFVYRETERSGGSLVGEESGTGFIPYAGAYLDHDPAIADRKYTFRIDLSLDESARERTVALMVGPGDYPRDIYLNGHLLMKNGDHGDKYNATVYYSGRVLLPPSLLKYGGEPNRIAVEAFPKFETSPLGDFAVGDWYDITRAVFTRNLFNIHLVQAAVVFAILISVFFMLLYFRSSVRDIRYLYCALVCLSFALGYLNMSLYHDAADDVLLDKLSRTGLVLTALFLSWFAMAFTGIANGKRRLKLAFAVPSIACIIAVALQPDKRSLQAFFSTVITNFLLTPLLLITLGILIAGFVRKRDVSGAAVLAGFLTAVAASLHDIYYLSIRVAPFCYFVAYGYLALIVSIFFVLALEQARVVAELGRQSARLDGRNRVLAEMVTDLTSVSEGLVDSSAALERTLRETLDSIADYGAENNAIGDAFRAQSASVAVALSPSTHNPAAFTSPSNRPSAAVARVMISVQAETSARSPDICSAKYAKG